MRGCSPARGRARWGAAHGDPKSQPRRRLWAAIFSCQPSALPTGLLCAAVLSCRSSLREPLRASVRAGDFAERYQPLPECPKKSAERQLDAARRDKKPRFRRLLTSDSWKAPNFLEFLRFAGNDICLPAWMHAPTTTWVKSPDNLNPARDLKRGR